MAYTDIDRSSDYFNTVLYSGSASSQSITGVGFQPDLIIVKNRTITGNHYTNDIIRGASQKISTNSTSAEFTQDGISSFDSDGFTVGTASTDTNNSGNNYVSWNFLASNTTASNTDGSITSTVSANTTSGFSIVKWSGNGTLPSTIGHGLGVAPKMIIVKQITASTYSWLVYHEEIGNTHYLGLNTTDAKDNSVNLWNNTSPTSSVFTINHLATNVSGVDYISYCFAEKKGFSKFGSYTGNGNADGTFVYTGFKPAFLIIKRTNASNNWHMYDNKRDTYNVADAVLYPNSAGAEGTDTTADFLSNGFKLRTAINFANGSGDSYIYMAFAENPFTTSTGIPTTAR